MEQTDPAITARLDAIEARLGTIQDDLAVIRAQLGTPRPVSPQWVAGRLGLTAAEGEVAAMMADGMTVRDIAAATGRQLSTVNTLTQRIYRKLGITTQVQLVRRILLMTREDAEEG